MIVASAADTSDCFVGVAVVRSVGVCAGATSILVRIAVAGYVAEALAFGAAYGFSFILLDSDQVSVDVQTFFDQFVGSFRVVNL